MTPLRPRGKVPIVAEQLKVIKSDLDLIDTSLFLRLSLRLILTRTSDVVFNVAIQLVVVQTMFLLLAISESTVVS